MSKVLGRFLNVRTLIESISKLLNNSYKPFSISIAHVEVVANNRFVIKCLKDYRDS